MHPPSTKPPSRTTANPLTAIVFLVFPVAIPGARIILPTPQLTEKPAPSLRFTQIRDHLPVDLLQECRSAPIHETYKTTLAATA
jgi:hypothetical protein